MRKAAVIGYPAAHSLSPRLHGYWLKQYGIEGSYTAIEVPPIELPGFIRSLASQGFAGINLTVPHKEAVMAHLSHIDDTARAIGAVNTITVREGLLEGSNTDAYGFTQNLKQGGLSSARGKAVVLGAGGAARAVVKALKDEGFKTIIVANRTMERAKALAGVFSVTAESWDKRNEALTGADVLINTTTLGMQGKDPLSIDLAALPKNALVNDIVYTPLETPLLAAARARGNIAVDGLGMLIHQAVPAFAAWFGVRPTVDEATRKVLLHG